ncbi:MAG: hypothetical protein KKE02_23545 [Alphaproteobacteria bacterium]|nr:hypothetical protein [Alphaproteobacteria bacterium]MBU1517047.1 hypothetical protein [Alphaproteobacteria bacterium]MBU2093666.1 hypothetical protein [Alphaproteobacteria bacterium]MBU2154012.1 hypothetical protein [Alphaproteobacteria bacterium]MBU2308734.1 hypothetical protein [Alphaproteobacteria bacterium]
MTARTGRLALVVSMAVAATACSRPSWTDPETSKGSRELPRPTAPPGVPTGKGAGPPLADWLAPLMGRPAAEAFPNAGTCLGNTDALGTRFLGGAGASRVVGWAWDPAAKAPVARVILTDEADRIVGGGETGYERPDVAAAMPAITSNLTGWAAVTPRISGRVGAYGILQSGRARCSLAGVDL